MPPEARPLLNMIIQHIPTSLISDTIRAHDAVIRNYELRKRYLKKHRRVQFTNLLVTGKLDQHLVEVDRCCEEQLELITRQMAKQESVTESLKASDQMEWVRRMNSIRSRAEEIILQELVFLN